MLREMQRADFAETTIQLEREHQHLARLAHRGGLIASTVLELCGYMDMSNLSLLLNSGSFNSTFERLKDAWQEFEAQSIECRSQLVNSISIEHADRLDEAVEEFRKLSADVLLAGTDNTRRARSRTVHQVRQYVQDHLLLQLWNWKPMCQS